MQKSGHQSPEAEASGGERSSRLPAHAVAAGSPVGPECMEGWKVDCRSKRSFSIFTALEDKQKKCPISKDLLLFESQIKPQKQHLHRP